MTPPQVKSFAKIVLGTWGNAYFCLLASYIIKDLITDADEQPDEEIHKVKSGKVPSTAACIPMKLGFITLPAWMCSPTQ